jgi:hypothetical protein
MQLHVDPHEEDVAAQHHMPPEKVPVSLLASGLGTSHS